MNRQTVLHRAGNSDRTIKLISDFIPQKFYVVVVAIVETLRLGIGLIGGHFTAVREIESPRIV